MRRHGKIEKSMPPIHYEPLSYKNEEKDMAVTITQKTVLLMSVPQCRGRGR